MNNKNAGFPKTERDVMLMEIGKHAASRHAARPTFEERITEAGSALMRLHGRGMPVYASEASEALNDIRYYLEKAVDGLKDGDLVVCAYYLVTCIQMLNNILVPAEPVEIDANLLGWFESWLRAISDHPKIWRSEDGVVTVVNRRRRYNTMWPA